MLPTSLRDEKIVQRGRLVHLVLHTVVILTVNKFTRSSLIEFLYYKMAMHPLGETQDSV